MSSLAQSSLGGLFTRTFLYGVYLTILAHCLRWLLFADEGWILRPKPNRLMLTATVLVFVLTTGHVGVWLSWALNVVRGETSGQVDSYLLLTSNVLENATTLLVDSILVYRCWLVYNKSWLVIFFPLLFWLSNIGLFISYTYEAAIGVNVQLLVVGLYSCNIVINVYATSAIIYQILRITKRVNSRSDLLEVCRDLVQCGVPYLFTNTFTLSLMEREPKSMVFPLSCAMNSVVSGIVFNLILIRAGLHRTNTRIHEHRDGWGSSSLHIPISHTTGEVSHSEHQTVGIVLEKLP